MTGPRVPLLSIEAAKAAAADAAVPDYMAELNIFRALLHQPALAKRFEELLSAMLFRGRLDARLRELLIMRLGWLTGSVYEWTQHWRIALMLEVVSEDDLLAVRDWQNHAAFGAAERAVLAATDEIVQQGSVSADTWDACEAELGESGVLVEMVTAIATWRMVSSILQSLDIPLEDGTDPWPPDGRAASPAPRP